MPVRNFLKSSQDLKIQINNNELIKLSTNVNKLSMQLNNLKYKRNLSSERKARTRTLIQIGGLVEKSGLRELFNIELGEDLEQDIPSLDKAALLLGFLSEAFENIDIDEELKKKWLAKGIRLLKQKAH